nr:hypothetical protein [Lachnospiraceae bacterium]
MKTKMMKENRTIAAALLAGAGIAILSIFMFGTDAYAATDPGLSVGAGCFAANGDKYTLSVELTRTGEYETGLIAESTAGGQTAERVFATKSGSGTVTFGFDEPHDEFRVIAVDKNTLAPICDDLKISAQPDPADRRKNNAKSVEIPAAGENGTAAVIKAITEDLIVAGDTVDALEALTTETVSVQYEKSVTTVENEGTKDEEVNTVWNTVTEDMTRFDAISYDDDAVTEAAARLGNMSTAYDSLKTASAVLYDLAGDDPEVNKEIRFFALQAGEVAKAAEDAAFEIEMCFKVKKGSAEAGPDNLVTALGKIRAAAANIRICGGAGVLNDGCFGVYPKGADLALVADTTSSAVILCPDNGKVTQGTVSRADGEIDASSVNTDHVVIVSGEYTGVIETPSADSGSFYDAYDLGGVGTSGLLQAEVTRYDFSKCPWYLRASVESLTEYAGDDLGIASAGTYDAWGAMLSAFLAATDN